MRVSLAFLSVIVLSGCVRREPPPAGPTGSYAPPPPQPGQTAQPAQPAWTPAPAALAPAPITPAPAPTQATPQPAPAAAPVATAGDALHPVVGAPSISGELPDFERVAQGLDFKPCAAGASPSSVLVALRVASDGSVTSVQASSNEAVPASLGQCVVAQARGARFGKPPRGDAIVSFVLTFAEKPALAPARAHLEETAVAPPGSFGEPAKVATFVRAKARACYRDALRAAPRAEGHVSVAVWIDEKGEVSKVDTQTSGPLPDSVSRCIEKTSRPARFRAPSTAPAVVTVPVRLALKAGG
jgi:hypothetical protein